MLNKQKKQNKMEKEITIENLQQEVAELKAKVESLQKERDNYYQWYNDERERANKMLRTVKALAQLTADAAGLEIIQPVKF